MDDKMIRFSCKSTEGRQQKAAYCMLGRVKKSGALSCETINNKGSGPALTSHSSYDEYLTVYWEQTGSHRPNIKTAKRAIGHEQTSKCPMHGRANCKCNSSRTRHCSIDFFSPTEYGPPTLWTTRAVVWPLDASRPGNVPRVLTSDDGGDISRQYTQHLLYWPPAWLPVSSLCCQTVGLSVCLSPGSRLVFRSALIAVH